MRISRRLFGLYLATLAALAFTPARAENHAVLIGVSKYDNPRITQLSAPGNDVRRVWKMLTTGGRFAPENIVVLANDTDAFNITVPRRQDPTAANILAALDAMARTVKEGDFVVFYFSGHGTFAVQPPPKSANAFLEPDGHDEVLLAQDAGQQNLVTKQIPGGILDDVLKEKLDAIREKATVWAIIDSCHAGGATRSISDDIVYKSVDPSVLGVEPLSSTPPVPAAPAAVSVEEAMAGQKSKTEWIAQRTGAKPLIAFLAAAEDAKAIERRMMVPGEAGTHHSLFTHFFLEVLARRGWDSYRQIAIATTQRLAQESKDLPVPVFEGALEERPFDGLGGGVPGWPAAFDKDSGEIRIGAGLLAALRPKAIVQLKRGGQSIGYAEVASAQPDSSIAKTVKYGQQAPPEPAILAEPMLAEVIETPVDFRLKVTKPGDKDCDPAARGRVAGPHHATAMQAIDILARRQAESFPVTWLQPNAADADLRLCVSRDVLYITSGDGRLVFAGAGTRRPTPGLPIPVSADALANELSKQLWRVLRQQNLLRIAANVDDNELARKVEIRLRRIPEPAAGQKSTSPRKEERRCSNTDTSVREGEGEPLTFGAGARIRLTHCDRIALTIRNAWDKPVDVTLLYLDSQGGISAQGRQVRLPARSADGTPYGPIIIVTWCPDGQWPKCLAAPAKSFGPVGTERLVVIITEANGPQRDFYHLAGPGLAIAPDRTANRDIGGSKFASLMRDGLEAGTLERSGVERTGASTIKVFAWEVVPPGQLAERDRR